MASFAALNGKPHRMGYASDPSGETKEGRIEDD
jgi:hypothetical protein